MINDDIVQQFAGFCYVAVAGRDVTCCMSSVGLRGPQFLHNLITKSLPHCRLHTYTHLSFH